MRSAIKLFRIVEDLEHFLERHALTIHGQEGQRRPAFVAVDEGKSVYLS